MATTTAVGVANPKAQGQAITNTAIKFERAFPQIGSGPSKNQIKKGRAGTRELLRFFKDGYSIALMIDQRVSEGIKSNFYGRSAFTTTIPAQLIKKFKCKIVPVYIERLQNTKFKIMINKPLVFDENQPIEEITQHLNYWLEEMISKNPGQWIWSHNRWK